MHGLYLNISIVVPSWRVNDIIADRYAVEAGSTRVLRSRDFQKQNPLRVSLKRQHPIQSDREYEDLSDEAYLARHARFETEEIKQERLSILRLAEDELRQRLEQRERDSWVRFLLSSLMFFFALSKGDNRRGRTVYQVVILINSCLLN